MGRKLLKLLVSREDFLRRSVTVAYLRLSGIVPETRHLFRNDTKLGPTESNFFFFYTWRENIVRAKGKFQMVNSFFERLERNWIKITPYS